MSSHIAPLEDARGQAETMPRALAEAGDMTGIAAELDAVERGAPVCAHHGAPEPQVLREMADAARTHHDLAAEGLQVRFGASEDGGSQISIVDLEGNVLRPLTAQAAVDIARGKSAAE